MLRRLLLALMLLSACAARAAEWQLQNVSAPARVTEIETVNGQVRVMAGGLWYALKRKDGTVSFEFVDAPRQVKLPEGALPDGQVVTGRRDIARAWLAEPTDRYDHGILGRRVDAGALVIETRDGKTQTVRLKTDAVFEDVKPRIVDLNGDGHDHIVVVKSYLKRGSALAVIGERKGRYEIIAETPPLGRPYRWLDPAGIADFTGDHKTDIALVRQPHAVGALEIWSWHDDHLQKAMELPDAANHVVGTRAIDMAAVADFNGDNRPDLAIPSLDRSRVRIVSFSPSAQELASIPLPAKAVTNFGLLKGVLAPVVAIGLADGSLVVVQRSD